MLQYYVSSCFIHLQLKAYRKLQVCVCHSNKENDLQDTQSNDVITQLNDGVFYTEVVRNTIQAGT